MLLRGPFDVCRALMCFAIVYWLFGGKVPADAEGYGHSSIDSTSASFISNEMSTCVYEESFGLQQFCPHSCSQAKALIDRRGFIVGNMEVCAAYFR